MLELVNNDVVIEVLRQLTIQSLRIYHLGTDEQIAQILGEKFRQRAHRSPNISELPETPPSSA